MEVKRLHLFLICEPRWRHLGLITYIILMVVTFPISYRDMDSLADSSIVDCQLKVIELCGQQSMLGEQYK